MSALHAEWTKFRTVRGWVLGLVAAGGLIMLLGLAPGMSGSCGKHGPASACTPTIGPGGEQVNDHFTFVHQPLTGDGSVTVRVASLTGSIFDGPGADRPGLAPWAKAGLMIKSGVTPGSTYAAVLLTGSHGVRTQWDYTHDEQGPAVTATPWLRLSRTGATVTTAASADGVTWTDAGSARLAGLPATAEVGLFVTAPQFSTEMHEGLLNGSQGGPSQATGTFEQLTAGDGWAGSAWHTDWVGGRPDWADLPEPARQGSGFRVSGSGDVGPAGAGVSVTQTLVGTFTGLIVVVVLGAVAMSTEYRRGLIRTTFAASPHRLRVLAAKAAVIGGVAFGVGVVAAAIVVVFGQRILRDNGVALLDSSPQTELRVVAGTGALLAVSAVLALGLGALFKRSVTAVTVAIVIIVLPYLLAVTVLPVEAARRLLTFTPAAAFALQQAVKQYPQVDDLYAPSVGYFPLAPWAGLAVLLGWTALILGAAAVFLHRRDA
ncbi:ABC transporter permease subunit [Actinoplanes sp. NPDC020271]|uniref:ABC transporter permease subunit n=1 Tax=Actinoplanes sp. NPDC020271 TaxID=3363896 RepID=UPI0037AD7692